MDDLLDRICLSVRGHARDRELRDGIEQDSARAVDTTAPSPGYAGAIAFFGHAIGKGIRRRLER